MKKLLIYFTIAGGILCSSCSDWLDVLPKNEQVTTNYWQNKEEVESVLSSGYMFLRRTVPTLIDWSELRGQSIYSYNNASRQKLQNFQLTSSESLCKWGDFYKVLNMANSVIQYAPEVQQIDETYLEASMNAHVCEAYFLRGLVHFYLLRNFGDIPLVLAPYVNDENSFVIAQSSEAEVIAQIKDDIRTALATGAAPEFFEDDEWEGASKGRATKWALYALMADVCLWNEDYDECIEYADLLINATATRRPAFMANTDQWFEIFYPGNSNESIFEVNWNAGNDADYSPTSIYTVSTSAPYQYTEAMCERLHTESEQITSTGTSSVRALWGAYVDTEATDPVQYCIWKYQGIGFEGSGYVRSSKDGNWIVYRMADVILMKAEALVWKGAGGYQEALDLIHQIRIRAGLGELDIEATNTDELTMLEAILYERDIEFAAEGKRWYDLLRFGKTQNYKYKDQFINIIVENTQTANPTWLRSVLKNNFAWYLPVNKTEMETNPLLIQNPYYGTN